MDCSGQDQRNPEKADELKEKAFNIIRDDSTNVSIDSIIGLFQKALQYDNTQRSLYLKLAYAYRKKKAYDASIRVLNKYQKRRSEEDLAIMSLKARSQYCMGAKDQARNTLEDALKALNEKLGSKRSFDLLCKKVDLLMFLGRRSEAEQLVDKHKGKYPRIKAFMNQYTSMYENFGVSLEKGVGQICESNRWQNIDP